MTAPLDVMKSITGTSWSAGDSATIDTWLDTIGARFPEMAGYCRGAKGSYFPWCGLTVAYCMCRAGIKPVFGATDLHRFLWAEAWLDWGTPVDTPQAGDALVFDFGGGDHHVTLFEADDGNGRWSCRGGNQSHTVDVAHFLSSQCQGIRRPPMAAASNFADCLKLVLVDEGGYSNDAADPGGPTNFGITLADYRAYINQAGTAADVRAMTVDQAAIIYRQRYWDVLSCDSLPLGVNYAVFDYGVNSGVSRAAKVLQGIVGVDADGEVGPDTVVATLKADPVKTINAICDERMAFLHGLGTWGTFGRGWTNRVEGHVRPQALAMVPAGATTQPLPSQAPQPLPLGANALANLPLRYLIGIDQPGNWPCTAVEAGYDATAKPVCALAIKYANLYDEKKTNSYGPYLPQTGTAADYGELVPDPAGAGFWRNVSEQITRAAGWNAIEWDNRDAYDNAVVLKVYDQSAAASLGVIGKNPDASCAALIAHPACIGIVAEQDNDLTAAAHVALMAQIRSGRSVRFVAFDEPGHASGSIWAHAIAGAIKAGGHTDMLVTYSPGGEYTSSVDISTAPSPPIPTTGTIPMNPDLIGLLGQLTNVLGALQPHLVPPAVTQPAPPIAAMPAPAPGAIGAAGAGAASPAAATAPAVDWIRLATDAFALFMAVQASPAAMAALHSIHDNLLRVKSNA